MVGCELVLMLRGKSAAKSARCRLKSIPPAADRLVELVVGATGVADVEELLVEQLLMKVVALL